MWLYLTKATKQATMKVVKRIYGYNIGGKCANCKKSRSGDNTIRALCEYLSGNSYIVEPFNLCKECYNELPKK